MNLIYNDLFEKSENITIFINKLEKVNEFDSTLPLFNFENSIMR